MPIEWSKDLETGIVEIDLQHQSIFDKINALMRAANERRGKEEVVKTLEFLERYVQTHFEAEERYMEKRNYPDLRAHRAAHLLFTNDLMKLKRQFMDEGATIGVMLGTQRRVVDWLFEHIRGTDKMMAKYLRERRV